MQSMFAMAIFEALRVHVGFRVQDLGCVRIYISTYVHIYIHIYIYIYIYVYVRFRV